MFHIGRYFLITSAAGVALMLLIGSLTYSHLSTQLLIEHETRSSVNITKVLGREIWPGYSSFLDKSRSMDRDELLKSRSRSELNNLVSKYISGTDIIKVKLYNLDGITVYSTEAEQIGLSKLDNPGFMSARDGRIKTNLTFRDEFHTFENIIVDISVVSSYIPLYDTQTSKVSAVLEVYSDVTQLVAAIQKAKTQIALIGLISFLFLFSFLYLIVQRGKRIMKQQAEELQIANERIKKLAYQDSLTELYNRNHLEEKINKIISKCIRDDGDKRSRQNDEFAILYIDLNNFKEINDNYGHNTGDMVLAAVSQHLRTSVREQDEVYRFGGDEFVILLQNIIAEPDIKVVIDKVKTNIAHPIEIAGITYLLKASIGFALFPKDGETLEELINHADTMMYQDKHSSNS